MAWKEGVESMLKWVDVSVEGETRADGINHSLKQSCIKHKDTYIHTHTNPQFDTKSNWPLLTNDQST